MMSRVPRHVMLSACLVGCGADGDAGVIENPFVSEGAATASSGEAGSTSEAGGDASTGGSTGGSSTGEPAPSGPPVDVVFVIDNSIEESIADFQLSDAHERIIDAAPALLERLESALPGVSLHVGVVTGDAYAPNGDAGSGCDALPGLVRSTVFADCGPYVSGRNYMASGDDFESGLACAARVGVFGDAATRVGEATLQLVEGDLAGPGLCNEGFLRDDAWLLVVLVADGDETDETGHPDDWQARWAAARGGNDRSFVVSLIDPLGPPCDGNAIANEDGAKFALFTSGFGERGMQLPICDLDYRPGLLDAADRLSTLIADDG